MRRTGYTVEGQRIVDLREERGWNATRLAEKVGISLAFMRRIELGERQPSPAVRKRITEALGVPLKAITVDRADATVA